MFGLSIRSRRPVPALALGVWLCCVAAVGHAQAPPALIVPPTANGDEQLTADVIQRRLKQTEESTALDEAAKAELRATYQRALERLQAAADWAAKAAQFEKMVAEAPVTTKQAQAELALQPTRADLQVPADATLAQLEESLSKKTAELNEDRRTLEDIESELKRRASRRAELPKSLTALRERKAQLETELATVAPPELSPEAARAQRTLLQARLAAVNKQIQAEEKEPQAYDATSELLTVQRDLVAARIPRREQELKQLQQLVDSRSRLEKERQARVARNEAARAHPLVRPLAEQNLQMAEERTQLDARTKAAGEELALRKAKLGELQKRFQRTEQKIKAVGLTDAVGVLLRRERSQLPYDSQYKSRDEEIRAAHLELLSLQDRRTDLANIEQEVQAVLDEQPLDSGEVDPELEAAVRESLQTRREYLDGLIADYESHFNTLVELDEVERQLAAQIDQYSGYIDERILWIRSSTPLGLGDVLEALSTLRWLAGGEGWTLTGVALLADMREHQIETGVALLLLLVLTFYKRRLRYRLQEVGQKVLRSPVAPLWKTAEAAIITLLISINWPGLLVLVGWRLRMIGGDFEFAAAIGSGLIAAATVYFPLELLRQACRPMGLAEAHFQWPKSAMLQIRRGLRPLMLLLVPCSFIVSVSQRHGGPARDDALGRFAFIVAMLAIAWFAYVMLRANSTLMQTLRSRDPQSWLARLQPFWLLVCAGLPILLTVIGAGGYYYTALHLAARLNLTFCYVLALLFLNGAILRWVMLARVRLARQQALERVAEQSGDGKDAASVASEMAGTTLETPELDVRKLGSQTRQLLRTVLALITVMVVWLIWVDVLPALGVLNRVELWSVTVSTNEIVQGIDDGGHTQVVTRLEPVTLADLSMALILIVITIVATRNLPGMLEMTVLSRLPIDAGGRYAVSMITRYLMVVVGIALISTFIGLSWTNVQWLIAAISVGLGFGLQEIFANFISGLILLFERPIRVGDIVTIDNVTGIVSKIQARATTITNWDRQEYVVPNKEFITGRLLNWTLSNPVNRILINVGVAHGSDTEVACELLRKIVEEQPLVMNDPAPLITFEGFGEGVYRLSVRCYLPDMEKRLQTIHELHTRIVRDFRAAGVEIAHPQRDIHIRSVDGVFPLTRAAELNGDQDGHRPANTSSPLDRTSNN